MKKRIPTILAIASICVLSERAYAFLPEPIPEMDGPALMIALSLIVGILTLHRERSGRK